MTLIAVFALLGLVLGRWLGSLVLAAVTTVTAAALAHFGLLYSAELLSTNGRHPGLAAALTDLAGRDWAASIPFVAAGAVGVLVGRLTRPRTTKADIHALTDRERADRKRRRKDKAPAALGSAQHQAARARFNAVLGD